MTDTFNPTPSAARAILRRRGPITPDKARAADFYADMHRLEPWWPMWILADLTAAAALLLAPIGMARGVSALYAAAYAVSVLLHARRPESARVLTGANPDRAVAAQLNLGVIAHVTAVLIVAAGAVVCLLPATPMRVVGALFAVLVTMHAWNRVATHVRARRILATAPNQSWWPQYVADRELRAAAAEVVLHPAS